MSKPYSPKVILWVVFVDFIAVFALARVMLIIKASPTREMKGKKNEQR